MTLQHLKYILTVAEKGSISEAARELHISQPSLSNAIKEVEKELCFPVFTRNCLGIASTKEGTGKDLSITLLFVVSWIQKGALKYVGAFRSGVFYRNSRKFFTSESYTGWIMC